MASTNPILAQTPVVAAPKETSSLEDLQAAIKETTARSVANIKDIESDVDDSSISADAIVNSIEGIASAAQTTALARDNADLTAQNATLDAFEAAGGVKNQVRLIAKQKAGGERTAAMLAERADILDDEHTGIQIIDSIINEFKTNQLDINIQASQAQETQTARQISLLNSATEGAASINAKTKRTINAGTIEANQRTIAAKGTQDAAKATIDNIRTNAAMMKELSLANRTRIDNLMSVYRLEGEEKNREIVVARAERDKLRMELDAKKWEIEGPALKVQAERTALALAAEKDPKKIEAIRIRNEATIKKEEEFIAWQDQLVEHVQRAQSAARVKPEDRETILFNRKDPATAKKYALLQQIGSNANPVLGTNAYEAQINRLAINVRGVPTDTVADRMLTDIIGKQAAKYVKSTTGVPRDIAVLKEDLEATKEEFVKEKALNIAAGDSTNPYSAPPMATLETIPAVTNTALYQNVLKAKNFTETNPQLIMDAAIAGILAKAITHAEAADGIEAIFTAAAVHNNTVDGGFRRVGLPNQETYNFRFDKTPDIFTTVLSFGLEASGLSTLGNIADIDMFKIDADIAPFVAADLMDVTQVQQAIALIMRTTSLPDPESIPDTTSFPTKKADGEIDMSHIPSKGNKF